MIARFACGIQRAGRRNSAIIAWRRGGESKRSPGRQRIDAVAGTREITKPLFYDDGRVIHACEAGELALDDIRLVWTKCNLDVPRGREFSGNMTVTCSKCVAAMAGEVLD
jgi:hypothetical protein